MAGCITTLASASDNTTTCPQGKLPQALMNHDHFGSCTDYLACFPLTYISVACTSDFWWSKVWDFFNKQKYTKRGNGCTYIYSPATNVKCQLSIYEQVFVQMAEGKLYKTQDLLQSSNCPEF